MRRIATRPAGNACFCGGRTDRLVDARILLYRRIRMYFAGCSGSRLRHGLAHLGAAVGMLIAIWAVEFLVRALPAGFAQAWDVRLGPNALLAAAVAGVIAATTMAGVAWLAVRRVLPGPGGMRIAGRRGGRRLSAALIASNFAVALAVAVSGALLLQSYQRLAQVDPGFAADGVVAGLVALPPAQYADGDALRGAYTRLGPVSAVRAGGRRPARTRRGQGL
jgi:hypothetical protein